MSQYVQAVPSLTAGGGGGPTSLTIGTFDGGTANANALTISSNQLFAQSASATFPGMINTTSQTLAGDKTFLGNVTSPTIIPNASSFGAVADFSTDNTAAIQTALNSFGVNGGTLVINKGVKWNPSSITFPNEVNVWDYSGWDQAHSQWTAQQKIYMKTASPGTKNADEFQILSDWHPAVVLDNTSDGSVAKNASLVLRQQGVFKWLVGKGVGNDNTFLIGGNDGLGNITNRFSILDTTGEVGIGGVPTAGKKLLVYGSTQMGIAGSIDATLLMLNATNDSYLNISTTGTSSQIWSTYSAIAGAKPIVFAVGGSADEKMRLTANGNLSIANTNDTYKLDVTGDIRYSSQLISTIATGTAPLVVASTTQVANLNAATAGNVTGTVAINHGGTGQTTASAAFDALSPMTTLGDTIYGGTSGTGTRLAGNITSTKKFLTQTGSGAASAAPIWNTIASADLPSITLTGDVTGGSSGGTIGTSVSAIAGTTVSGTTGSTNVVFSASPTLTGTANVGSISATGTIHGRYVRTATAISYTALTSDTIVGVTSTAAPRTITLPDSATAGSGFYLVVKDESGAAGTNNITITRAGSDTIDGATSIVITVNYGVLKIYSDGAGKWFTL